ICLHQQLHNNSTYIADDGFSQAINARLPRRRLIVVGAMGGLIAFVGILIAALVAVPLVITPLVYWAAGLTLVSVFKMGLLMAGIILAVSALWMARQFDWI
ncbi:MAG TPA: hypothetical protein PK129_07535, partial [Cellvibrionaceae bacterium]|nr:hypothetical protein [Cellvibrionaceae bacterium]